MRGVGGAARAARAPGTALARFLWCRHPRASIPKPLQLLLIAAMLAAATSPSAAQRPDKPKGPKDKPAVRVVFQDPDRGVFRDYYRGPRAQVKPLPPGIAKNLERGKPLPPGY